MSAPVETSVTGYVRAARAPSAHTRMHGSRWVLIGMALVILLIVVGFLTRPDVDATPMSIKNPGPDGVRALAQVATQHGVSVRQIHQLDHARITDPAHTTVVIASATVLYDFQAQSLLNYPGPLVVLGADNELIQAIAPDTYRAPFHGDTMAAACQDADAVAAATVSGVTTVYAQLPADVLTCFTSDDGAAYVRIPRVGKADVVFISDSAPATNAHIAQEGNAALLLRLIGQQPQAVWYVGQLFDSTTLTWGNPDDPTATDPTDTATAEPSSDLLPPGTGTLLYALALAVGVVAWWRARRFGRLVHERLPVVIRSAEATRGRARLYRAAHSTGRAGASLRAAAAQRMGSYLGVPRTADRDQLVAAIVRASGRTREHVDATLYGPPPRTESAMMTLLSEIDTLESEVHPS